MSDDPRKTRERIETLLRQSLHYPSDERASNQMGKRLGALAIQRDQLNGP